MSSGSLYLSRFLSPCVCVCASTLLCCWQQHNAKALSHQQLCKGKKLCGSCKPYDKEQSLCFGSTDKSLECLTWGFCFAAKVKIHIDQSRLLCFVYATFSLSLSLCSHHSLSDAIIHTQQPSCFFLRSHSPFRFNDSCAGKSNANVHATKVTEISSVLSPLTRNKFSAINPLFV